VTAFTDPSMHAPRDITTDAAGGMWFDNNASSTVGRIDPTGAVRSFVLPAVPTAIAAAGNDLWFTVNGQDLIGRVTSAGVVTTFTDPSVHSPGALAADGAGNIYFGNDAGASIGRMTPDGTFTNYSAPGISPQAMVGGFGDIWFTNGAHNSITRFGTAG
jgi:virginiamycin B lyase